MAGLSNHKTRTAHNKRRLTKKSNQELFVVALSFNLVFDSGITAIVRPS